MRSDTYRWQMAWWMVFAFVVWVIAFRGFLSSAFALTSDAISYYDHTKFFIENLKVGVYPLWDPFWYNGVPNDFFLRRIGAFNPFYLIILLIHSIGIPYTLSYLWGLALYYWGGAIAFYLLAMRLYHDRLMAYAGYLMLLFSALGTRLFDSYMMLVTVPLIWFFYFLTAFSQKPQKTYLLGMVLCFIVLAGTYIPFYFLIILGFFIVFFMLFYFDQIPKLWELYRAFFNKNKILAFFCLLTLAFSFVPTINFFMEAGNGQIAMPLRHGGELTGHALTVPHQTLDWGAVEDLTYSAFFSNLKLYKFAVVYVPFFFIIPLLLGCIGRISRLAAFFFFLGITLFCCIVPHGLRAYDFFYPHVFFLKYFRNLHFFIWFFLIPLFILLVLEHWRMFTQAMQNSLNLRLPWAGCICVVHAAAFIFVWWRHDAVVSTYIMISLSLIFWLLLALRQMKPHGWAIALLTLAVLVQPLEAYHYFSLKADGYSGAYNYDFSYTTLKIKDPLKDVPVSKDMLYYISKPYDFIYQNISNKALANYLQYKFLLVDHLQPLQEPLSINALEHLFLTGENKAIVYNNTVKLDGDDPHPPSGAQFIDKNTRGFKVLSFNANHLKISLNLPYEKFLVYNDSYDPYWQVSINHQAQPLYKTNGAFKGLWVPAGENIIDFTYGCWWQYAMNILLSVLALAVLVGMIGWALC